MTRLLLEILTYKKLKMIKMIYFLEQNLFQNLTEINRLKIFLTVTVLSHFFS